MMSLTSIERPVKMRDRNRDRKTRAEKRKDILMKSRFRQLGCGKGESMSIKIDCIRVGMLETNCYMVYDEEIKEAIITDPGDNGDFIIECIEERGVTPVAILLTHGHGDHIFAIPALREKYDLPVYVHELDEPMLENGRFNLSSYSIPLEEKDIRLKGGEELTIGGMRIKVLFTPGHTPGGVCYYFEDAGFVLSGDTMFYRSWGRTDFPGGSEQDLMRSLLKLMEELPPETIVYPGHEMATKIADERRMHGLDR